MDNRKLEFYALAIVLVAFCFGTIGLIIAVLMKQSVGDAVPLVDGTLGTLAMAMWKDFSHSNQAQADSIPTPDTTITTTTKTIPTTEVKNEKTTDIKPIP
jgi:hypothetical protein